MVSRSTLETLDRDLRELKSGLKGSIDPPCRGQPVTSVDQLLEITIPLPDPIPDHEAEEALIVTSLKGVQVTLRRRRPAPISETDSLAHIVQFKYPIAWRGVCVRSVPTMKIIDGMFTREDLSIVVPPRSLTFRALELTPLPAVKVVILGQDPYHSEDAAMGLAFSTPRWRHSQPSVQNIFKELEWEYSSKAMAAGEVPYVFRAPQHGDLTTWAHRGVLLLNCALTTVTGKAKAHLEDGRWKEFVRGIIDEVARVHSGIVFMLWGREAQDFFTGLRISVARHKKLEASHPSPFSCAKTKQPFFRSDKVKSARDDDVMVLGPDGEVGCKHFRLANEYLVANGKDPIDWRIE